MERLEQIGFNEKLRKKIAKKMVKEIVKVNGELYGMRFGESEKSRKKILWTRNTGP